MAWCHCKWDLLVQIGNLGSMGQKPGLRLEKSVLCWQKSQVAALYVAHSPALSRSAGISTHRRRVN